MVLVPAKDMLVKARKEGYAVGHFNINNLEWTKAILAACEEAKSPVILGVSEGAAKYMTGFKTVAAMVKAMVEEMGITVPVALHLDHGSYEGTKKAIEAGFSSVMFDGSHYPFEENIEKSKEMIALAHEKGISIECEVGSIGGEEDGVIGSGELADPQECKTMAELGIDFLAAGIGNIHGKYPENWAGLSFETLENISKVTGGIPLVLHGGSGIPTDQIQKAISLGVSKVNVNTECQLAFAEATRKYIEEGGAMNIFFKIDGTFVTPELNGSILPGITRASVIELLKSLGEKVEERKLPLEEVYEAYDNGKLEEVFLCGTAAVIAPVGELFDGAKKLEIIKDDKPGEWTQKLYNLLTGIQLGKVEDKFGWVVKVEE